MCDRSKLTQKHKEYYDANRDIICKKRRNWSKNKRLSDPHFKLRQLLSNRINHALKGRITPEATIELLGCTLTELKNHIETQFVEGMTWDNHGKGSKCWHIDHILPCAFFDLSDYTERKICFHYSNLQPMWEPDNIRKADSIDYQARRGM